MSDLGAASVARQPYERKVEMRCVTCDTAPAMRTHTNTHTQLDTRTRNLSLSHTHTETHVLLHDITWWAQMYCEAAICFGPVRPSGKCVCAH